MLVDRVAANADGAVLGYILPEVLGSLLVAVGGGILLEDTLHADILRHLGVGVLAVEEGLVQRLHAVEHRLVGVFLGSCQVFPLAKQLVGIEQRLVHAAMFAVEESLEVAFRNLAHHVDAPVGQLAEHLLGLFAVAIEIGIAQAGQNLMLTIERHPSPVVADGGEVALIEFLPRLVDGLAANEAIEAFRIVVVGILTVFHDVEHIVQTLFQTGLRICIMTGGIGQRQGRNLSLIHI